MTKETVREKRIIANKKTDIRLIMPEGRKKEKRG